MPDNLSSFWTATRNLLGGLRKKTISAAKEIAREDLCQIHTKDPHGCGNRGVWWITVVHDNPKDPDGMSRKFFESRKRGLRCCNEHHPIAPQTAQERGSRAGETAAMLKNYNLVTERIVMIERLY